ncbi:MAG TPA: isopentenyl phosphate kinase [Nitrososphaera sp.]|nr:isopentenyl phosphate kinase [Nitrososphaera sp.]
MLKLALIKLGGSVVTFKDKPLTANIVAIDSIARALKDLAMPAIIVHGGGSFGHYWSVQYDMHTKPSGYDPHGVSIVHESMVSLNQIIVNAMLKNGLSPYGIPPSVFTTGHRPIAAKIRQLFSIARSKVAPVTFGDVVFVEGARYSILSGDSLMTIIAKVLRPTRVIFATNVDGIYSDLRTKKLIPRVVAGATGKNKSIHISKSSVADVTGGMQRKITEAFKIASSGMDVMMVNGLHPERIVEAALGRATVGTLVKGRRRSN